MQKIILKLVKALEQAFNPNQESQTPGIEIYLGISKFKGLFLGIKLLKEHGTVAFIA